MDYTFKPKARRLNRDGNLAIWQVEITAGEFYTVRTHAMSGEKTAINNAMYQAMEARKRQNADFYENHSDADPGL